MGNITDTTAGALTPGNIPGGVTSVTIELWGSGGAGGGARSSSLGRGGGGGGGAYARWVVTIPMGAAYTGNVAAPGAGVSNNKGGDGNNTTFVINGITYTADHGIGGNGGSGGNANGGAGGLVAGCTPADATRQAAYAGGSGFTATSTGGGGGSSAGTASAGNNATSSTAAAAVTGGGIGGAGRTSSSGAGSAPASGNGGGGGGAYATSTTVQTGGAGAAGEIVVSWSDTNALPFSASGAGAVVLDITPVAVPTPVALTDSGSSVDVLGETILVYGYVGSGASVAVEGSWATLSLAEGPATGDYATWTAPGSDPSYIIASMFDTHNSGISSGNNNSAVRAAIMTNGYGEFVAGGDFINTSQGDLTAAVYGYDATTGSYLNPDTYPIPGDHDMHYDPTGTPGFDTYFASTPGGLLVAAQGHRWYARDITVGSVTWRMYYLSVVNTTSPTWRDLTVSGSPQYNWLVADLAANAHGPVGAYIHVPFWSVCTQHAQAECDTVVGDIRSVLTGAGLEFSVSGHHHQYARWPKMDASGALSAAGARQFTAPSTGYAGRAYDASVGPASGVLPDYFYSDTGSADNDIGYVEITLRQDRYEWRYVNTPTGGGQIIRDSGSSSLNWP